MIIAGMPEEKKDIAGYSSRELRRMFKEHLGFDIPAVNLDRTDLTANREDDVITIGTATTNPALAGLIDAGFLKPPVHAQGYSVRCGPHPEHPARRMLAVAGGGEAGTLYALRDIEHYHLKNFKRAGGGVCMPCFERMEQPAIEYRGHWVWGCNMPDKQAWIENMSRWKLNELIHWDNFPPERAASYVRFAHERGVRVVWGFGWGWMPEWNFKLPPQFDRGTGDRVEFCPTSEFNRDFLRREILRKIREDYAPTGCDGIYFQSFTECPKCCCAKCKPKSMGELMVDFVNPIIDAIKRDFPDLWISCGIHHDFGDFSFLANLDERCNIYWENCESGVSVRGEGEDFGYINKSLPYGHGFGKDCPADPAYTEESLRRWMESNAVKYVVPGGLAGHYQYMRFMQNWARRFLGKRSEYKHASVVTDHSVFCRRTPFPHVALAEAQWNPFGDVQSVVDGILSFLGIREFVARMPETDIPTLDPMGKPPWLCNNDIPREGHSE